MNLKNFFDFHGRFKKRQIADDLLLITVDDTDENRQKMTKGMKINSFPCREIAIACDDCERHNDNSERITSKSLIWFYYNPKIGRIIEREKPNLKLKAVYYRC